MRATAAAMVLVLAAACSHGGSKSASKSASTPSAAPALSLAAGTPSGMKVGLIVSSSGPGADVRDMAAGAYVAAFRVNGAAKGNDHLDLLVADDSGTSEGSTAAVKQLNDQGVMGIVYASTGDHVLAGAAAAAELGLAVVFPYADDARIKEQGATSFLAAPTVEQVARKLVQQAGRAGMTKVALVRQAGTYGDAGRAALAAAGLAPVIDTSFNSGDPLADMAKSVKSAGADGVVVWAESGNAVAAADALTAGGVSAPMLFGNRAAVPAFGHAIAAALSPSVLDGAVSAGEWIGPDTPTAAVDAFYVARSKAVSDGGVSADLTLADVRSHDAVLALVEAAKTSKSSRAADVLDAVRTVETASVAGAAGVPMHFGTAPVIADSDVAVLAYSTIDDGRGRYPAAATGGGHWQAVAGTFTPPDALKGLDDPYGG
jgi:hypothetical protein